MLARTCSWLIAATDHRVCCRIPDWTANIGRPWDTFDVAPWNLYNVLWRFGQWVARTAE